MKVEFILNGEKVSVNKSPDTRLIDLLRNHFNLTGTKEGCSEGECGSCMVLINKKAVNSCLTAIGTLQGKEVTTIEGIRETKQFEIIKNALEEAGAVQCGFCTPGIVISAVSLFLNNKKPTKEQIREGISGNICRCTGYSSIVEGIDNASKKGAGQW